MSRVFENPDPAILKLRMRHKMCFRKSLSKLIICIVVSIACYIAVLPSSEKAIADSPFNDAVELFGSYFRLFHSDRSKYQFSRSEEPVSLTLMRPKVGNIQLSIPRAYLAWKSSHLGGVQDNPPVIHLWLVYPSMRPWMLASQKDRGELVEGDLSMNTIQLWISGTPRKKQEAEILAQDIKLFHLKKNPNIEFNLQEYKGIGNGSRDVFVEYKEDPNKYFYMYCVSHEDEAVRRLRVCRAASDGPEKLTIGYRFRRIHLPQWQAIDNSIRNLVESFITPSKN